MQFSVTRESLLKPLQMISGVVEKRQTLPVLSNVLLSLKDSELSLTGTDLEVELEFKDDAISEIANKAITKKTGARGLRSILENILLKTMFELPDMENVIKVTVDKSSVQGKSCLLYTSPSPRD